SQSCHTTHILSCNRNANCGYGTREVGGGRATRQPGQVRKEAALTSPARVIVPASHPFYRHAPDASGRTTNGHLTPPARASETRRSSQTRVPKQGAGSSEWTPAQKTTRADPPPTVCWLANTAHAIFRD